MANASIAETFSLKDLNASRLASLSAAWGDPAWVLALRQRALADYLALPWPDKRNERWKRTPLEKLALGDLTIQSQPQAPLGADRIPAQFRSLSSDQGNGAPSARAFADLSAGVNLEIPAELIDQGVVWQPVAQAFEKHRERIAAAWERAIDAAKDNKFKLLSLAVGNGGLCLIVPRGHALRGSFQFYQAIGAARGAYFPLNFVFLEEAAEAHIWEELVGIPGQAGFVCSFSAVELKENAKASFYDLQYWNRETSHFQFKDVLQGSFSRYNAIVVAVGGQVFRNETNINLASHGAENKVLGVLFGDGDQAFETWITQNHTAPKTTSDIQYRGALNGRSQSFFSGMVAIAKEGQQSDAYQSAKTLLLSADARADAIPNLEILADDVKCSHGAAVGPVDEDQKFYLMTRGMDTATAEETIVQGFLEPVIAEVPSVAVQERLRAFVENRLKGKSA